MLEEFAVQYKTFVGGDFDRLVTHRGSNGKPHTRETAQLDVDWFNRREAGIARLVTRQVSEWEPAEHLYEVRCFSCDGLLATRPDKRDVCLSCDEIQPWSS